VLALYVTDIILRTMILALALADARAGDWFARW